MSGDHDDFETLAPPEPSGGEARYTRSSEKPKKPTRKRAGPTLKARAIDILSRREHSRLELQRKLAPHADDPEEVEALLDDLERQKWLSTQRFAHSLVHRRSASRGAQSIVRELRQHGVTDEDVAALSEQLKETETDRAREVWERKFGQQATNQKDYARQYRFLASRGFSSDSVRRVLGAPPPPQRSAK